ncbi:hypothetical protein A2757_01970 [Candidatus Giovannonibacteria bacterium RIFCSPHIGHO2_01_FULL_48_47]|nr:MAG: hypothetical protein A2757_01970 [Candidatus Giovannonibacteria bacterium RIFCSPHIGHO2_01_FULL_48_47]OGF67938.1 MAG: hypothetical protein A3D61_02490 [Candidatus Giovannonibacteria bacterium RIFCSPHIGHO2_02_FULL_48_15]OGF88879.1 MAG: hypothetical protein A3B26_01180 [Candidatus Giovannonibacteria bacterium RIFCSPLOWO2_01_FULL_48_47]OGF95261.1 MAG: hypothetical protein A2433_01550 [Candidatus Giovannonibacteria bacterium RIFOXYC1_FULL_48_8]OGF96064.1 MAG: hypothetical protein A2613_00635
MQSGFIQILIILALLVVIISLLGVSLGELFSNKTLKDNFSYVFGGIKFVWKNYLLAPVKIIFGTFKDLLWEPLAGSLEKLKK